MTTDHFEDIDVLETFWCQNCGAPNPWLLGKKDACCIRCGVCPTPEFFIGERRYRKLVAWCKILNIKHVGVYDRKETINRYIRAAGFTPPTNEELDEFTPPPGMYSGKVKLS